MSKSYQHENSLADLRRLRSAGTPVPIEEDRELSDSPPPGVLIRQIRRSSAIELNPYATAYVIQVRIVPNLPGPFYISTFHLELPWQPSAMVLVDDPAEHEPPSNFYRFDGSRPMRFSRTEVLNHLDDVRQQFPRGHSLQGFLLWYADELVPEEYVHGDEVPAFVVVVNQHERAYRGTISLYIDRTRRLLPEVARKRTRRNITGKAIGQSEVIMSRGYTSLP